MDRQDLLKKYLPEIVNVPEVETLARIIGEHIINIETAQLNLNRFADKIIELSQTVESLQLMNEELARQVKALASKDFATTMQDSSTESVDKGGAGN